jgi:glycosyltransferase involved in cell wall biosynthesis
MDKIVVSVLLPMYNAAPFIEEAVNSILSQSFSYFELIIIDDCSTDNSVDLVTQVKDDRIVLIKKAQNSGYTDSLNYGLKIAKGKFIARMDADDISLPNRFETQVNFLEQNKEVILCGSWFKIIGSDEVVQHPTSHHQILLALLDYCAIGHPTVMFKKELFLKNNLFYDKQMEPAEDHNLWVRAIRYGQLQNIPEVLLHYRLHQNQISVKKKIKQDTHSQDAKKFHMGLLYDDAVQHVDVTEKPKLKGIAFGTQKKYVAVYLTVLAELQKLNKEKAIFESVGFGKYCNQKKSILINEWFDHSESSSLKHLMAFVNPVQAYFKFFNNSKKIALLLRYLNPSKW